MGVGIGEQRDPLPLAVDNQPKPISDDGPQSQKWYSDRSLGHDGDSLVQRQRMMTFAQRPRARSIAVQAEIGSVLIQPLTLQLGRAEKTQIIDRKPRPSA
jgi:hypothetical protein